jgi:5-(carboxyamino)imidazole ribonucleotide synthase
MEPFEKIGIVGGGQLAVMMAEAASRIGLGIAVLASSPDDPIFRVTPDVFVGNPKSLTDLRRLADMTQAITFDHELVDPAVLDLLAAEGVVMRPGPRALAVAIDKHRQFELFKKLGLSMPETVIAHDVESALAGTATFAGEAVLKMSTGGYDGRGVLLDTDRTSVREWFHSVTGPVLVQQKLSIDEEIAVQVVRSSTGEIVQYSPVRTTQANGMCTTVEVPSGLHGEIELVASSIARTIAEAIDVVGVLTVELFAIDGELHINEIAARPHNSGHLTIESARTSQFENHLRAVAGHPLGDTDLIVTAAAMCNIVGSEGMSERIGPLPGHVAVHLYGKVPRPGRKLGHVTCVASTTQDAVAGARRGARDIEQRRFEP